MDLTDYCIGGMHLSGNSMQNIASSEQIVKVEIHQPDVTMLYLCSL